MRASKKCSGCQEVKSTDMFYVNNASVDKLQVCCKLCDKLRIVWSDMKRRCYDKTNSHYSRYGGRGIAICKAWSSLDVFMEWCKANGWREGLTIDRVDNDGDYTPRNVRFLTRKENTKNRPHKLCEVEVRAIKHWCKTGMTQAKVAKLFGVSPSLVSKVFQGEIYASISL